MNNTILKINIKSKEQIKAAGRRSGIASYYVVYKCNMVSYMFIIIRDSTSNNNIYIYIEREREIERERCVYTHVYTQIYIYVCINTYVYIYIYNLAKKSISPLRAVAEAQSTN